jgi:hypothetical protein
MSDFTVTTAPNSSCYIVNFLLSDGIKIFVLLLYFSRFVESMRQMTNQLGILDSGFRVVSSENCCSTISQFYMGKGGKISIAAELITYGRFGNNLYQLTHALLICEYLHVHQVFIPARFLFFNQSFTTTRGITIYVGVRSKSQATLRNRFYFIHPRQYCMNMDLFSIASSFRTNFHTRCGYFLPIPDALYFHVRSGDIMRYPSPHHHYAQPPCKYYLEANSFHGNQTKRILFSDSAENPCVNDLLRMGAKLKITSVFDTIKELIHADLFVLGRSTFSLALMLLSKQAGSGQFYLFAYKWSDIGTHWNCVETKKYYENVMVRWKSSPDQIALLKTERCHKWSHVTWGLPFYYHHARTGTPFYF